MKTLYLSDLDGTLLNRETRLTERTASILNQLVTQGLCFSFATARSWSSAQPLLTSLQLTCPAIYQNGTFLMDPATGQHLSCEGFSHAQRQEVLQLLEAQGLDPICYAMIDGRERLSFVKGDHNSGTSYFLGKRLNSPRLRECHTREERAAGDGYYFVCIGTRRELQGAYEQLCRLPYLHVVFQQELYRPEFWLEIMPATAGKAHGLQKLKQLLSCDRVVAFGDGLNDLPLFEAADEAYAVANAAPAVKQAATGIIGSNEEDGVAQWLLSHYQ